MPNLIAAIVLSSFVAGCAAGEDPIPLTTLVVSDPAARALGVATWDIIDEAPARRVIGRGDDGAAVIEALVSRDLQTPDTRVHIDVLAPDPASFDLLATGERIGDDSPIAGPLYDDLGHRTLPFDGPVDGFNTASSESSIWRHGTLELGWSLFGYGGTADVSEWCSGEQRSEESGTWTWGEVASCWLDWKSPIVSDCRGTVHFAMAPDRYGSCHWDVIIY